MRLTITICFSILFFMGKTVAQLPSVLLLHASSQNYVDDVDTKLTATGSFGAIDQLDIINVEPTLSQLTPYDVILLFTDDNPYNAVSLGDTVAAYLDGGGAVVNCVFALAASPITGAFATNYQIIIPPNDQEDGTRYTLGTVNNPTHPIMSGVSSFDGGSSSYRSLNPTLVSGADVIAEWSDGQPLVAVKSGMHRVDLNFYPPSSDARSDFWEATTDGTKIMENSLKYAMSNLVNATEKKAESISFKSVFPNPNEGNFSLSVNSKINKNTTLQIVDMYGKTVQTQAVNFYVGDNTIHFKTELEKGLYSIGIPSENVMYKMMVK